MSESVKHPRGEWRDPLLGKLFLVGVLVLVLLVPIEWIRSLIFERQERHASVKNELTATWGGAQTLLGPVLVVPYLEHWKTKEGEERTRTCWAYFLPQGVEIDAAVVPEVRSRGIFDLVLYRVTVKLDGAFSRPDFSTWKIPESDVQWADARLSIGVPDLRGMQRDPVATWDGKPLAFEPGAGAVDLYPSGMQAPAPGLTAQDAGAHRLSMELDLAGSEELRFVPSGKETQVTLSARWPDPSFVGAFLPAERVVEKGTFRARWKVSYFARAYPQQWRRGEDGVQEIAKVMAASSFGFRLIDPVDFYRMSDRSVKYAVLFVVLTFLTFALFEILSALRIHPVQYLLVGLAICLFYLLLLSGSEHLGFGAAYVLGTVGTVGLIGGYTRAVLGARRRAVVVTSLLGALYGYLYVLLQLEDYALALGTAGLFLILAVVMYLTRHLDWYALTRVAPPATAES